MFPEDFHLYRKGYTDDYDDWHSLDRWEGTIEVHPSSDYRFRVWAELRVWGTPSSDILSGGLRRSRPHRWELTFRMGQCSLDVASGRCKTLKEALSKTRVIDHVPYVRELLRSFYSPKNAKCVWVKSNNPSRWEQLSHEGWIPYATFFTLDGWEHGPIGEFLALSRDFTTYIRNFNRVSYSSGGSRESEELRGILFDWFPEEV